MLGSDTRSLRLPAHETRFRKAHEPVKNHREKRKHQNAGHHRIDIEDAFCLENQVANTAEPRYSPITAPTNAMPTEECSDENTQLMADGRYTAVRS